MVAVLGGRRGTQAVRLIDQGEVARFNLEWERHHRLGHRLVGATLRYVAVEAGAWVALVGFGSAAYRCRVRDVTMGEDRSQVRTHSSPHAMASMRTLAIGARRLAGAANLARGWRWASRDPARALPLLGR